MQYLEENTNCPKCDILLHQSHPLLYVAHDRTLQSIVYKLVANLERDELERQIKFYDEHDLDYPPQLKEKLEQFNLTGRQTSKSTSSSVSSSSSSSTSSKLTNNSTNELKLNGNHVDRRSGEVDGEQPGVQQPPLAPIRIEEPICITLEPLEGLKDLERKFILCPCQATITHLKKMVALNIFGNLELYKEIDIVCGDEILGKDHTLKFIRVTKWKDKVRRLVWNIEIFFRIVLFNRYFFLNIKLKNLFF